MIAEKPNWIRHEGMQIFSIDIQPGGLRFATGGGDHKVRIWNMKLVDRDLETNESTPKLLATLRDHFGSVNCVRWAKHGRYVASGSDDQVILIHERKPGSGTTEFGSGEPPDIENWKVAMTLRGHTADVVDLNWSPDDSTLASGSLDNTVHVWNMSSGICTAVLRGHSSLVKGVTWDPIGSFIASQSDDKTVIIWRTSDWSIVHRTDGHWTKSLGSTFFRRLGWSPCGHFVTTTHGFQKPRHSAPVLERGEWSATFDFLGHNAPIIVVKFNHSMFRRNFSNAQEVKAAPAGWTNGTSKTGGKESQPYNIIAIGSQDRTITVWTTASPRPLFVAKHFFTQSVVDLSWQLRMLMELLNAFSIFSLVLGRLAKLRKIDRLLMCWWLFTGLTHMILEGYFVFSPEFYKDKTACYLAEVWKEYSKGDSRYAARESGIVAIEGITAVLEGPACLLAVYAIATRKSYSYILQLVISLGQLYGTAVYFVTSYLDGDNFAASIYYYYAYYIIANASWVVIPTLIIIRCWKKISAAFQAQDKMKTKVR